MQHLGFKQKLAKMLCYKLKEHKRVNQLADYQALQVACQEWTEHHYQLASERIGVSHSSFRRVFQLQNYNHTGFNKRTKQ